MPGGKPARMDTDPRRDEDTAEGGGLDSGLEGDRERAPEDNEDTAEGGALDDEHSSER